jgi:hypothetical protein
VISCELIPGCSSNCNRQESSVDEKTDYVGKHLVIFMAEKNVKKGKFHLEKSYITTLADDAGKVRLNEAQLSRCCSLTLDKFLAIFITMTRWDAGNEEKNFSNVRPALSLSEKYSRRVPIQMYRHLFTL